MKWSQTPEPADPLSPPAATARPRRRRWKQVLLWAMFCIAMALLLVAAAASYRANRQYAGAARWVEHTHVVLRDLERVQYVITEAESDQRGYLLSRDTTLLAQYHAATPLAQELTAGLVRLTSDNPRQNERMALLQRLTWRRLHGLEEVLRLADEQGSAAAAELIVAGPGRSITTRILQTIAAATAEEERLYTARSDAAARAGTLAERLTALTVTAAVALIILAIVASLALRRNYRTLLAEIARRERAAEEVRRLNATLDQRVRDRTRELQDANAQLEAFGFSVSHDLRAPLRAIQGFATALAEECGDQLSDTCGMYAGRVSAAARRMDGLIEDLLAYSRLSRAELELRSIPLDGVVREALADLDEVVQSRGVIVRVRGPLPWVRGQRPILVQIVSNLLSNAMKFVVPGSPPSIEIWAQPAGDSVRLCIHDQGIGIDPQYHDRIFRVFERLHSAEEYPGTGIGLAIVRKGAERLGGRAGVESSPGRGSTFWIELPLAPADRAGGAGLAQEVGAGP